MPALRERLDAGTLRRVVRPPRMTISEWADAHRHLSREASAEPGRWRTERAPYLRGIMDALCDPLVEDVVVMSASQVGKTEVVLNAIGYYAHQDPAPLLVIQPNVTPMAEAFSKDRVVPMFRDTPALRGLLSDPKARTADNTILHKTFPGGHLTIGGANSPAGLASRPIRILLCDEVDRYPPSAGAEGDPVSIASKRTSTFWNRKRVLTSSPTVKGISRIEAAFAESDQRYYHVRCSCGHGQRLTWAALAWEAGDPETAHIMCEGCRRRWTEVDKPALLSGGEWIESEPGRRVAGFHLNALYSPWARWSELVREWLAAQGQPERLKTFVNTVLAETWQEDAERVEPAGLMGRREEYGREVPAFVGVLTAAADVQADRIEVLVRGWGAGEESALVALETVRGDPSRAEVWHEVDRILTRRWDGLPIAAACIDSGYLPEPVYRYVAPRQRRGVYATKGLSQPGHAILNLKAKRPNAQGVKVLSIGTEAAKDMLFLRLKVTQGAGCYHWPAWASEEYFAQLTAEQATIKYRHGRAYRVYEKEQGRRNEALDLEVLAYAALLTLPPSKVRALGEIAARRQPATPKSPEVPEPRPAVAQVRRILRPPAPKGWVNRF